MTRVSNGADGGDGDGYGAGALQGTLSAATVIINATINAMTRGPISPPSASPLNDCRFSGR